MRVFPSIEGEPSLDKVFRRFPHTIRPLLEYHDRLLRDPSPLTGTPPVTAALPRWGEAGMLRS